jgi:hypothetical protein
MLSITSGNTRCFRHRHDYDRYHFAYMYAMHHAVSCMNVVTHQRSSKGGFCTDKEMARTSSDLSSCRETFRRALPFCQPQKPSMSSHVRAPEVHLYCTLVALAMGIHFFAIGNSNVVEVQHGECAFKDESPSFLPRQPEASKHYNAASVRPESCALFSAHRIRDRIVESSRRHYSCTLALKNNAFNVINVSRHWISMCDSCSCNSTP